MLCRLFQGIYKKYLPELVNEFSKVAEYKINIQKSIICPYTSNKQVNIKIKTAILLELLKNETFRCKSNKTCVGLVCLNYTILIKEIEEDLNKWSSMFCSWFQRLKIVKI